MVHIRLLPAAGQPIHERDAAAAVLRLTSSAVHLVHLVHLPGAGLLVLLLLVLLLLLLGRGRAAGDAAVGAAVEEGVVVHCAAGVRRGRVVRRVCRE